MRRQALVEHRRSARLAFGGVMSEGRSFRSRRTTTTPAPRARRVPDEHDREVRRVRDDQRQAGRVIIVTGAKAAGKSTVADLLAERLPRSVHVRGDVFRRMVVNGRADMGPDASPEALAQLRLRYDLATTTADRYAAAGFTVVLQDVVIGPELAEFVDRIVTPDRYLVVLAPSVAALE